MKAKIKKFKSAASAAVFFCSLLISSGTLFAETKPVLIYGSELCGYCQQMRSNLDAAKTPYTFYDVNKDNEKNREMWSKLGTIKHKGSVTFPVVDIDGKILVSPKYDEVKALLGTGETLQETDSSIILYGSELCGYCQQMRRNLDAAKTSYIFYDVKSDKAKNREMWSKLGTIKHKGSVTFPVVDIDGKILVSPKFDEVKALLGTGETNGSTSTGKDAITDEDVNDRIFKIKKRTGIILNK